MTANSAPDCLFRAAIESVSPGGDCLPPPGRPISIVTRIFPFSFGRNERTETENVVSGDGVLLAEHQPYHVSRKHCVIEAGDNGDGLVLRDVGSTLGTMVDGVLLSRRRAVFTAPLGVGEHFICLGGPRSPHCFRVVVSRLRER